MFTPSIELPPFPPPVDPDRRTLLYLVRHGETSGDNPSRYYGQLDVSLSERGIRQSHATAERLSSIKFDAVYSSDLQRATYMADCIAEPHGLPVRKLEVFRERRVGIFQGLTEAEMCERHPGAYGLWVQDKVGYAAAEGGENFEMLQQRVIPAVRELTAAFDGCRVALACHAGPIRVTLAHALGMPIGHVLRINLDFAGVSVIEFRPGDFPRVKMMNG